MRKPRPKLLVFASGSATSGGSGFENLVNAQVKGTLDAHIVGVVSNYKHGGVRARADRLEVPFHHLPNPQSSDDYQEAVRIFSADWQALSGWIRPVVGLDPRTTFNIHPGPLPQFGGQGMYGHHVHEAVLRAFHLGEISASAVSMHFVTAEYDMGPVCFMQAVEIHRGEHADELGRRVLAVEHAWQPLITQKIVHGEISWDGQDPASLQGAVTNL